MRPFHDRLPTLLALLVTSGALAEPTPLTASTLLIPRTAEGTLDFIDPGSGLRLASVTLDTGPRRVAVSPDGKRAAVLGCSPSSVPDASSVRVSIVDLEQPRELHRIELGVGPCPPALAWFGADRVAVDNSIVAAQQFLSTGGQLQDLAITSVIPRAVCHACTPESSAVK